MRNILFRHDGGLGSASPNIIVQRPTDGDKKLESMLCHSAGGRRDCKPRYRQKAVVSWWDGSANEQTPPLPAGQSIQLTRPDSCRLKRSPDMKYGAELDHPPITEQDGPPGGWLSGEETGKH